MAQLEFFNAKNETPIQSKTQIIAESMKFSIELVESLSSNDAELIISISEELVELFGKNTAFTKKTVRRYFNYPKTFPFVAKFHGKIIGLLIGIPIENFEDQSWALADPHFGEYNTIYTYAFIFSKRYQKKTHAKTLKRVYLSWLKKRNYQFATGHVQENISKNFSPSTYILQKFPNWRKTGKVFEYYIRPLA